MDLLFISTLSSESLISAIYKKTGNNPGFAIQKFNRLIAQGLVKNGNNVSTLSSAPISSDFTKKNIYFNKSEVSEGINYNYVPYCKFIIIKRLIAFVYSFCYVFKWGRRNRKNKRIICDVLNISINIGAQLAAKLLRIKSVGIMTDMPGLMVENKSNKFGTLVSYINKFYLKFFNYYVFLTEEMNAVINTRHRPYIVMEGIVDDKKDDSNMTIRNKSVVYAGGLYEEYGLKTLIESFTSIEDNEFSLDLFGSGRLVPWIKTISHQYPKVKYHGVVDNKSVVMFEKQAILLVNPRPTNEKFTKFSFPSKNMEYMTSGTPVLTTKLPGMPKEYYDYVYVIESEDIQGFKEALLDVFRMPESEINEKGAKAKDWIYSKKNKTIQTRRILELIS